VYVVFYNAGSKLK